MIEGIELSKHYKKNKALNAVSFQVKKNSIFGIIGPNGSGKSTLIKILTDLIRNYDGRISRTDLNYTDMSLASEEFGFPSFYSVRKVINLFSSQKSASQSQVNLIINTLQLEEHLNKNVKELSQGLKQRLNIACALLGNSKVIIFDEPNNGLDPDGFILLRQIIRELKQNGKTIIISSHLLNELEQMCDEVLFLKKGEKVIQEKKNKLTSKYGSLESAYLKLTSDN